MFNFLKYKKYKKFFRVDFIIIIIIIIIIITFELVRQETVYITTKVRLGVNYTVQIIPRLYKVKLK